MATAAASPEHLMVVEMEGHASFLLRWNPYNGLLMIEEYLVRSRMSE